MTQELDTLQVPAGTLIHINGLPFRLSTDTLMEGRKENAALAGLQFINLETVEGKTISVLGYP